LKGLLIGNGWIDPKVQYPAYAAYAYEHDLIKQDTDAAKQVDQSLGACMKNMEEEGVHVGIDVCEGILNTILRVTNDQ
jgi:carboxypeptidase D